MLNNIEIIDDKQGSGLRLRKSAQKPLRSKNSTRIVDEFLSGLVERIRTASCPKRQRPLAEAILEHKVGQTVEVLVRTSRIG